MRFYYLNIFDTVYVFSQDAYDKRKDMWTAMDVNGNGYLSLAEVTKVNFLEFFLSNAL